MRKEACGLKEIVKVSKKYLNRELSAEEFCQYIFEETFRKNLGYMNTDWNSSGREHEVIVNNRLKVAVTFDKMNERQMLDRLFWRYEDGRAWESSISWGIVLNPWGIWLLNHYLYIGERAESFQSKKTVLEIVHGKNSDQHYYDFLSYENILGNAPNTNYFKDIAEYRNHYYKGNEKSWALYSSTLKRFFSFYSGVKGYFKNDTDSVYDQIRRKDFYDYIRKETKLEKENTLKNVFFYFKDFMKCMSDKGVFEISAKDLLDGYSKTLKKDERRDVIDPDKLKKAVQYLNTGKNKERDVALFLMELSFGLERRKLRLLKWGENIICNKNGSIENNLWLDGKKRAMPKELVKALQRLKELDIEGKYVFYRTKENGREPMREDVVNDVFGKPAKLDSEDAYYGALTPANMRASLVRYLLREGAALEEIIYLVNIEIGNLGNYISLKDIDSIMEKRIENKKEEGIDFIDSLLDSLFI